MRLKGGVPDPPPPALEQAEVDGSNENGYGEQHPSLATVRGLLRHSEGRRLVVHNGDISYARCAPPPLAQSQPVVPRARWSPAVLWLCRIAIRGAVGLRLMIPQNELREAASAAVLL